MKRQVDWLVNGSLTGPIFSRALNLLTQLEIFTAGGKDWPVNERNRLVTTVGWSWGLQRYLQAYILDTIDMRRLREWADSARGI